MVPESVGYFHTVMESTSLPPITYVSFGAAPGCAGAAGAGDVTGAAGAGDAAGAAGAGEAAGAAVAGDAAGAGGVAAGS